MCIALEAIGSSDHFHRLLHHNVCISIPTRVPLWAIAVITDHAVTTCVHEQFLRTQKHAQFQKKLSMTSHLLTDKPEVWHIIILILSMLISVVM